MKITILLDLDDTLLGNVTTHFMPAYIQELSGHFDNITPAKLTTELMHATEKMMKNELPDKTLEQVFDEAFYPAIGISKSEIAPNINQFYADKFPLLQEHTKFNPEAQDTVKHLLSLGHDIIIATNPLFPKTATFQRLAWAGLLPDDFPFGLISSYENYHFAKPNPAYFAEVLAQYGWKEQPVVMVGNSLANDIIPANTLGIPAFWYTDTVRDQNIQDYHPLNGQGNFHQAVQWIESIARSEYYPEWNSIDANLAILLSTPAAIMSLTSTLSPDKMDLRINEDEWSIYDVICHLLESDLEINLPRIKRVLEEENPFINVIHEDVHKKLQTDQWGDEKSIVEQFLQARKEMIAVLKKISPQVWERPARHSIFGPVNLKELIDFMSTHDRVHIRQIVKVKDFTRESGQFI